MALKIYNTFSKTKEFFTPVEAGKVKMYLCGPTVYDFLHIGNFRGAIFFNLVRNWLEQLGNQVTFVYNYTDVDDKIIKKAIAEGVATTDITERFIEEFKKDFNALGLRAHDHNPKVTEYMPEIVSFVDDLVKNEHAYVVDGEVFYSIQKFKSYGLLSGKKLDELQAGQRVEVDKKKQDPLDFVLWKPSKEGEPAWDSPWGKGRPGWHIECSAMVSAILGDSIDIHGGGIDLIFPHHENEIAQSEGRSCKCYSKYWMHNNFINLKDEKMSKSIGNVVTARSFLEKYHPEIMKYVMLSVHYRSLLNINDEKISGTIAALSRIYTALEDADKVIAKSDLINGVVFKGLDKSIQDANVKITKALNDDFNTGEMLANIFDVVRSFNAENVIKKIKDPSALKSSIHFKKWLKEKGELLALFQEPPTELLCALDDILLKERNIKRSDIDELVEQRIVARTSKDWEASDKIRDKLNDLKIEVYDGDGKSSWRVKL